MVNCDSYVYLAAINAMAELAYWKKQYFNMVVEFFVNPVSTLQDVAAEEGNFEMDKLTSLKNGIFDGDIVK